MNMLGPSISFIRVMTLHCLQSSFSVKTALLGDCLSLIDVSPSETVREDVLTLSLSDMSLL